MKIRISSGGNMSIIPPLRIALTTCDDIFDAGGVGTSITRIARGLSTNYNARVDILMLNSNQQAEFNPRGRNGIIKLDQHLDKVSIYKLTSWTGGSSPAQHWVDVHYALLELARERRYELMQAFYEKDGHKKDILQILYALAIPETDWVTQQWLQLAPRREEQYGFASRAHRNNLAEPRPSMKSFDNCGEI
jgi:hypothetical protein